MPTLEGPISRFLSAFADSAAIDRDRRPSGRGQVPSESPSEDHHLDVSLMTLIHNTVSGLLAELDRRLIEQGFEKFDHDLRDQIVAGYREILAASGDLLEDIAACEKRGMRVEGSDEYRSNVGRAREVVEDDEIRREALRMMPGVEQLDALAEAHRRSIGG